MPRPGLSSRLKHLRSVREVGAARETLSPKIESSVAPELCLPDFTRIGEFVYLRQELFPQITPPATSAGLIIPPGVPWDRCLFFDLETTGLSSGAGTVAFLAGFGRYTPGGFLLEQYFLSDYPGEGEFLQILNHRLDWDSCFISYNGRAFDANLLISRGLMQGLRFRFRNHFDLLYISRRLWRAIIGSCSLGNIEREVLTLVRTEDLPGMEVPERWFQFLRSGDPGLLNDVFSHHKQDILTLSLLANRIEQVLDAPLEASGIDRRSLALFLLGKGHPDGKVLLDTAYREGDQRAGKFLALFLKRKGDWAAAVRLWQKLSEDACDAGVCEELAKYYEHRKRSPAVALEWARRGAALLDPAGAARGRHFEHRILRLERKLAR